VRPRKLPQLRYDGSRPGVQSASLYDNFRKPGNYDVIDDVITRKRKETDKNRDHLASCNSLSYPIVKTASFYDNFCKSGINVIDDVIMWVLGNTTRHIHINMCPS